MSNLLQETLLNKLLLEDLDAAYERYYADKMDRETFNRIIKMDPTYKHNDDPKRASIGTYGKWLLKMYSDSNPMVDVEYWRGLLSKFDDIKGKLDPSQRDIFKYKTADALQTFIDANEDKRSISDWQLKARNFGDDAEFIGSTSNYEVYSPKTYEASRFIRNNLGNGDAEWCTGYSSNYFRNYTGNDGKLYIILNKKETKRPKNKFQVCFKKDWSGDFEIKEFRDANNRGDTSEFITMLASDSDLEKLFTDKTEFKKTRQYKNITIIKEIRETGICRLYANTNFRGLPSDVLLAAIKSAVELVIDLDAESSSIGDNLRLNTWEKLKVIRTRNVRYINCEKCVHLEEVYLGDICRKIEEEQFAGCRNLKFISLPDSLLEIGLNAFKGCDRLATIEMTRRMPGKGIKIRKTDAAFLKSKIKYRNEKESIDGLTGEITVDESLKEAFAGNLPEVLYNKFKQFGKHRGYIEVNISDDKMIHIPLSEVEVTEIHPTKVSDPKLKPPYVPVFVIDNKYVYIKGCGDFDADTNLCDSNYNWRDLRMWSMKSLLELSTAIYTIDASKWINEEPTLTKSMKRDIDYRERSDKNLLRNVDRKQRKELNDKRYDKGSISSPSGKVDKSGYIIPDINPLMAKMEQRYVEKPLQMLKKFEKVLKECKKEYITLFNKLGFSDDEEFSTLLGSYASSLKNYIGIYNSTVEEINNVLSLYKRKECTKDEMQTSIENIVKNNYRDNASKAISGVLKLTRRIRELMPDTLESLDRSELSIVMADLNSIED